MEEILEDVTFDSDADRSKEKLKIINNELIKMNSKLLVNMKEFLV